MSVKKVKQVAKTATGIMAGSVAVDCFKAGNDSDDPKTKLLLKAAGSLAAATSFHILKGDVVEAVGQIQQAAQPKKLPTEE